jgi:hypothetical protein
MKLTERGSSPDSRLEREFRVLRFKNWIMRQAVGRDVRDVPVTSNMESKIETEIGNWPFGNVDSTNHAWDEWTKKKRRVFSKDEDSSLKRDLLSGESS